MKTRIFRVQISTQKYIKRVFFYIDIQASSDSSHYMYKLFKVWVHWENTANLEGVNQFDEKDITTFSKEFQCYICNYTLQKHSQITHLFLIVKTMTPGQYLGFRVYFLKLNQNAFKSFPLEIQGYIYRSNSSRFYGNSNGCWFNQLKGIQLTKRHPLSIDRVWLSHPYPRF